MPAGRPSDFKDEYVEQAKKLALLGSTDLEMASFFGCSEKTFYNWQKAVPDFLQAIKDGKEGADMDVANSLYNKALGGDTTAMIFWLKNRKSKVWRDKINNENQYLDREGNPTDPPTGFAIEHVKSDNSKS